MEGDLREKRATIEYLRTNIESAESALYAAKIDREQLRREEKNLAGKSSRLELMAADLFSAFDRLEWDTIRKAANGLGQWIQNVQPMPDFPRPLSSKAPTRSILEDRHRQNVVYFTELSDWWRAVESGVQAQIGAFWEEDRRRNADQQDEVNSTSQLRRIESEISKLGAAEYKQRDDAAIYQGRSAELIKSIASLDQRLEIFGSLADEIARLEQIQLKHRSDYQQYLGAKPLADERSAREKDCKARREAEAAADATLRLREIAFAEADQRFRSGRTAGIASEVRTSQRSCGERIGQLRQRETRTPAGRGPFPRVAGSLRHKGRS